MHHPRKIQASLFYFSPALNQWFDDIFSTVLFVVFFYDTFDARFSLQNFRTLFSPRETCTLKKVLQKNKLSRKHFLMQWPAVYEKHYTPGLERELAEYKLWRSTRMIRLTSRTCELFVFASVHGDVFLKTDLISKLSYTKYHVSYEVLLNEILPVLSPSFA